MPILDIDGRRVEVDDSFLSMTPEQQNATVEEIVQALSQSTAPAAPATPQVNQGFDAPNYVLQQGNKGLANWAGAPVDLMAAGLNVGLSGADMLAELFGGNVDTRVSNPVFGSQWFKDRGAEVGSALGVEPVPSDAVSSGVRKAGYAAEGAAGALVPGFGLAGQAPRAAQSVGSPIVNAFRNLGTPYAVNPGATLARDAAAGGGAGLAAGMSDESLKNWGMEDSVAAPFLQAGASLVGGVAGAWGTSLAEGAARGTANLARNTVSGKIDPNAPINPETGAPYTRAEMDEAARVVQSMPTNRAEATENIKDNYAMFQQFARPDEIPTTGMLANDIGMAISEKSARVRNAEPFKRRDNARLAAASRYIDQSAPAGADPRAFTDTATRQYDDIRAGAQQTLDEATDQQRQAQRDIATQRADIEEYRARQPQASSALDAEFRAARQNARGMKNEAYDAADPRTPVPGSTLGNAIDAIDSQMAEAERLNPGAYDAIASRVRRLVEERGPEGEVSYRDITYGDLKALRAQISEARKSAVNASGQSVAGSGADVQRLDQLGAVINKLTDEINPDAARFYREEYAPRFKEGRAGEYGAAIDRSARTGGESSATRPTEFGDKFLRRPEDAASLRRALTPETRTTPKQDRLPGPGGQRTSGMFPESEQNVRDWIMGDLAKSGVLTDNAEIRYDRFRAWVDKNRKTIDQFPEVQRTVDAELDRARKGGMISKQMADEVARAKENLRMTESDLRRSALQAAIGNSPENAVDAIMRSGDPEKKVAEMVARLKDDKPALEGLQAAVRDWIKSDAGLTTKLVGEDGVKRVSRAKMENLISRHDKALAEVYTPEQMNALQRARKLLDADANLDVNATAGSDSVNKIYAAQNEDARRQSRMLEAGLKGYFGVLKGGGVYRTINLFLESLPNNKRGIENIIDEFRFNPELAVHLLDRPLKEVDTQPWNAKLNALLAAAAGAREAVDEEN